MTFEFPKSLAEDLLERNLVVLDHAFPELAYAGALEAFELRLARAEFQAAQVGPKTARVSNPEIRSDETAWIEEGALLVCEREFWSALGALRETLNRDAQLGLWDWEIHYARYAPGSFYRRHRDRFDSDSRRTLTWIWYLNSDWREDDHGKLRVFDKDGGVTEILPVGNRLVLFLSDALEHEVEAPKRERRSLTGWFRTRV